jgi:hypothetical protein
MLTDAHRAALLECSNPFAALFQEIAKIAQAKLQRSSGLEFRDVSCDFSGGVLTLRGRVPSPQLKQLAQANVAEVPGVLEIDNRVEVIAPRFPCDPSRSQQEGLVAVQGNGR